MMAMHRIDEIRRAITKSNKTFKSLKINTE